MGVGEGVEVANETLFKALGPGGQPNRLGRDPFLRLLESPLRRRTLRISQSDLVKIPDFVFLRKSLFQLQSKGTAVRGYGISERVLSYILTYLRRDQLKD